MKAEELGTTLNEIYFNAKEGETATMIHLFGIKYANDIRNGSVSPKKIAELAGIPATYSAEISKGCNLAKHVTVLKGMSIQEEVDREINVVRIAISGTLKTKSIIDKLKEALNSKNFSSKVAIVDIDSVEDLNITYSDLAEIVHLLSQLAEKGRAYYLFIASNPKSTQIFKLLLGSLQRGNLDMMLCHSKQHAEQMLNIIRNSRKEIAQI